MSRRDDLITHLFRLVHLARSVHLKSILTDIDPDPELNFWRLILGNHLDVSVLEWCKIFGSNAEPTHWKNIVPVDDHDLFRDELLSTLGVSGEEWANYWESMKEYRDRQVAHYEELHPDSKYPVLENALYSSYYYYKYLIAELRALGENGYPDDLEEYCASFAQQTKNVAERAIAATSSIREHVW